MSWADAVYIIDNTNKHKNFFIKIDLVFIKIPIKRRFIRLLLLFTVFSVFLQQVSIATVSKQHVSKNKKFGNWITHIEQKGNKKICYIYSIPTKTRIFDGIRGVPYFCVNYFINEGFSISVNPGFKIAENTPFEIIIEKKATNLNTFNSYYAVTYNSDQDIYLINKLIKTAADYFVIKSTSYQKKLTMDYYNLSGFLEALKYLESNCKE